MIGWLLYGIDEAALADGLSQASFASMLAVFVILLALSAVQAWRWVIVARAMAVNLSYSAAWSIVLIGLFFNQTLPSSIGGDAARVWRLRRAGVRVGLSIRTVVLDRLVALFALLLIVLAGLPALMSWIGDGTLRWAVPILLAGGFSAYAILLLIESRPLRRLLERLPTEQIVALGRGARAVFLHPASIIPALVLSVFIHGVVSGSVFLIGRDIGVTVTFWEMLVLFPPVLLLSMVPFSVAGWGVREGAMITALSLIGVSPAAAFTVSVLYGIVMVAVGFTGGVVWLLTGGQRPTITPTIEPPRQDPQ
jgi:uncharacterized protein (TIRG00374 family)